MRRFGSLISLYTLRHVLRRRAIAKQNETQQKAVQETLLASIHDVQTAISANDSKASAALIVHGLLVTGVLTLLVHLGSIYKAASNVERFWALLFLFGALASFLASIGFLLAALLPYRPRALDHHMRTHHKDKYLEVFFPLRFLQEPDAYAALLRRVRKLEHGDVAAELAAERIKLADILRYESAQTKWGYLLLAIEVLFVTGFLVAAGTAAL